MAIERLGNLGYIAIIKEATKGVPLVPTISFPIFDETLTTNGNLTPQKPIYGGKFATFQTLQGQRDHQGDFTTIGEPNTLGYLMDMLFTRFSSATTYTFTVTSANATVGATYTNNGITYTVASTITAATTLVMTGTGAPTASGTLTKATGAGDATITFSVAVAGSTTHTFGLSTTVNPNSYTIDISTGNVVKRFWGFEASKIDPAWNAAELRYKLTGSALGSFQGRTIATVATTTLTLDTKYDPAPNKGLVVGDLVRIYKASTGATLDTTIATVNVDGVTVTLGASAAAFAAGDIIHLRPFTVPTFNLLPVFLWGKTQFCFGATAAAALAATQTRVEVGSTYELLHNFEANTGSPRSGSFDPASLVRLSGDASATIKKFFDTPEDVQRFNDFAKNALQVRHFSGSTNQYEGRFTFNNITTDSPLPQLKADAINYSNIKYIPNYDQTDAQGVGATVINNVPTI